MEIYRQECKDCASSSSDGINCCVVVGFRQRLKRLDQQEELF